MTTLFLLVSRKFLLERLFERLNELECDPTKTNLFVLVDGGAVLYMQVRQAINELKFNQKLAVRAEPLLRRGTSTQFRRTRIAQLHNEAKQYISQCDYVLTLEDDGMPPKDALKKLLKHSAKLPEAGFISGLQIGRWLTPYIGGWRFDNPKNPTTIESVKEQAKGLVEIHAAGWYCCLVKWEHWRNHPHKATNNWGPDIEFGRSLSAKGIKNYIDTSIVVDHHTEQGKIINPTTSAIRQSRLKLTKGAWRYAHSANV